MLCLYWCVQILLPPGFHDGSLHRIVIPFVRIPHNSICILCNGAFHVQPIEVTTVTGAIPPSTNVCLRTTSTISISVMILGWELMPVVWYHCISCCSAVVTDRENITRCWISHTEPDIKDEKMLLGTVHLILTGWSESKQFAVENIQRQLKNRLWAMH